MAASNGHCSVVQTMLEHCADVNTADNEGRTPLHAAADNEHVNVVLALLCAKADASVTDNLGDTPLDFAEETENEEVQKMLQDATDASTCGSISSSAETCSSFSQSAQANSLRSETVCAVFSTDTDLEPQTPGGGRGVNCTNCSNIYRADSDFCRKCGVARTTDLEPQTPGGGRGVNCTNCGNIYRADSDFCRKCGVARVKSEMDDISSIFEVLQIRE